MASSSEPTPLLAGPDFHTITCVTWNASGRNVGLGTPDGFLLYSTEAILEASVTRAVVAAAARTPAASSDLSSSTDGQRPRSCGDEAAPRQQHEREQRGASSRATAAAPPARLHEVCRRVVPGGVGVLSLCEQSSVVVVAGVTNHVSACTVRLADASRPLHSFSENDTQSPLLHSPSEALISPFCEERDVTKAEGAAGKTTDKLVSSAFPQSSQHSRGLFPGAEASRFLPINPADLRCAMLAEATFPTTVSSVSLSPYFIIVTLTGDPRIPGSHQLYVFDLHLRQKLVFSPFPSRSNRFLRDCISLAGMWTPALGAGVSIRRFRALLPSPKKGAVRLLTLKHVSLFSTSSVATRVDPAVTVPPLLPSTLGGGNRENPHYSQLFRPQPQHQQHHSLSFDLGEEEKGFFVGDKAVHKAALRAVAVAQDGKHGVTIGETGTNIKLIEFINDTTVVEKMTLERGKTQAIIDSVSLHIVTIPSSASPPAAVATATPVSYSSSGYSTQHLVVCITSSGTVHLFLCDTATSTVVYSREKTLCPAPGKGFPFGFAAMFPQSTMSRGRCGMIVLQWNDANNAASYLAKREGGGGLQAAADRAAGTQGAHVRNDAGKNGIRLVAFDLAYALAPSQQLLQRRGISGARPSESASSRTTKSEGVVRCWPFQAYYFPWEK